MTAKGRLMGVMYEAAFTATESGELPYWTYARHANACATRLARGLVEAGFEPYIETAGNQQFFWVTPEQAEALASICGCETQTVSAAVRRKPSRTPQVPGASSCAS